MADIQYASKGVAGTGLGLGIAGTTLALLGTHLFGGFSGNQGGYVTKDELNYVQEIAKKDSEIALLQSEQNTEVKIADVYERVMTRVNADQRAQADWNASQSVINAQMSGAIATNTNSIAGLTNTINNLTKTVIPANNVCPTPITTNDILMGTYNNCGCGGSLYN